MHFSRTIWRLGVFVVEDDLQTIEEAVDRSRWGMTPPTSNAYYNARWNEIVFPARHSAASGFDVNAVDAVNYGSIGRWSSTTKFLMASTTKAQSLTTWEACETGGRQNDLAQFQQRGACVADQFDNYFIEPGVHHNGKLVLGESIGDLGGAKIAFSGL